MYHWSHGEFILVRTVRSTVTAMYHWSHGEFILVICAWVSKRNHTKPNHTVRMLEMHLIAYLIPRHSTSLWTSCSNTIIRQQNMVPAKKNWYPETETRTNDCTSGIALAKTYWYIHICCTCSTTFRQRETSTVPMHNISYLYINSMAFTEVSYRSSHCANKIRCSSGNMTSCLDKPDGCWMTDTHVAETTNGDVMVSNR